MNGRAARPLLTLAQTERVQLRRVTAPARRADAAHARC
jgi:hypothetical protein